MLDVGDEGFGIYAALVNETSPILHAPVCDCGQKADFALTLLGLGPLGPVTLGCRVVDSGSAVLGKTRTTVAARHSSSMEAGHVQPAPCLIEKYQRVGI